MEIISKNVAHLKIKENLINDYNEYYLSFEDVINQSLKCILYIVLVSIAFYNSIILLVILIPFSFIYPFFTKSELIKKRKDKLLLEFKDFLRIFKSFLMASYSVENSFYLSIKELQMLYGSDAMMVSELKNIVAKLKLNNPVDQVFSEFSNRTHIEDIMDFAEVFSISKANGGNIGKIIGSTINIINDKIEVKMDIETATASKRFEQRMMNFLPFLIIIYMNISSSEFLKPIYTTIIGRVLMTVALIVYFLAVSLSKKILDIEL